MQVKFEASVDLGNSLLSFEEVVDLEDNSSDSEIYEVLKRWVYDQITECNSPALLDDYAEEADIMGWGWGEYMMFRFGTDLQGSWGVVGNPERREEGLTFEDKVVAEYKEKH